jgi:hypothetical protein
MNLTIRLRGVGIAFAVCLISAPIAIAVTIALLPFWSWVESMSEIESVGHSGPAEWCYLVCYNIILACIFLGCWAIRSRANI